jgi:hypothetical protein
MKTTPPQKKMAKKEINRSQTTISQPPLPPPSAIKRYLLIRIKIRKKREKEGVFFTCERSKKE